MKILCPKCGTEINCPKEQEEAIQLLNEERFLEKLLGGQPLDKEAKKKLEKIIDLIKRVEAS